MTPGVMTAVLQHEDPHFGMLPLRRSTCWAQRRPAWHVARTRTAKYAPEPLNMYVGSTAHAHTAHVRSEEDRQLARLGKLGL